MPQTETPMPPPVDPSPAPAAARLRSGTAARLAGLPVTTLRVWERRYGVVAAPKTATGQRLYTGHDVQRLRLMKQLTTSGHAIGTLAGLPLDALQALAGGMPVTPAISAAAAAAAPDAPAAAPRVVVVGRVAARKLQAATGQPAAAVHEDLARAEASTDGLPVEALLVHLPSLQAGDAQRVLALATRCQARRVVVLYAFGPEAAADALRIAGAALRREPATGRDLARLVMPEPAAAPLAGGPWQPAPRRYSDETLAALAEMPSEVACECPRHLAEIVMQLGGFERYSAECGARSPADAALHRELSHLAATARTMFEEALSRVAAEEGLEVPG